MALSAGALSGERAEAALARLVAGTGPLCCSGSGEPGRGAEVNLASPGSLPVAMAARCSALAALKAAGIRPSAEELFLVCGRGRRWAAWLGFGADLYGARPAALNGVPRPDMRLRLAPVRRAAAARYSFKGVRSCAVIYSGGKDSHLALLRALGAGVNVSCLLTVDGGAGHAAFFHDLRKVELLRAQARLMGIPLFVLKAGGAKPRRAGVAGILERLAEGAGKLYDFDALVSGASDMDDNGNAADFVQAARSLGLRLEVPVAALDVADSAAECARAGVTALIVGVERAVHRRWLGREFGPEFASYVAGLRRKGVLADGNDFQTLVTGSPLFGGPFEVLRSGTVRVRERSFLQVSGYRAGARERFVRPAKI